MVMANHAYLRVWTCDFSLEKMIPEFARFLTTAPLSAAHDTFDELIVQAVDPGESPIGEWDLRPLHAGPAEVAAMAAQHLHSDTAYIASATWDLRSEEHTSELQSQSNIVCRLLLEKKKKR